MHYCEFPGCDFSTNDRMQIEYHHIIPKSQGGSHKPRNRIWLCRTCHAKVYVPGMTKGIHYKNRKDKIQLLGWLSSTDGKVLTYKTYDGTVKYNFNRGSNEDT